MKDFEFLPKRHFWHIEALRVRYCRSNYIFDHFLDQGMRNQDFDAERIVRYLFHITQKRFEIVRPLGVLKVPFLRSAVAKILKLVVTDKPANSGNSFNVKDL